MGLSIVVPNADFGAIAVAKAPLSLSHSPSHVFEVRQSNAIAGINNVTMAVGASFTGVLAYSSFGATVDKNNRIGFGVGQTSGSTVAMLVKNVPTPAADSMPVGIFPASPTVAGAGYFLFDNAGNNVKYDTTSHVGGGSYAGNVTASLAISGDGYELLLVSFDDASGLTLYHPRTAASNFAALAVGRTFTHPVANAYSACAPNFNSLSQEVLMFARWPSVLSAAQMDTVYSEVQTYYQSFGVSV